ncbi:MAG: DNA-binding protein [Lachnospiraceae bacterium]|nr:DNA-binding protein [Lachnospiraceae bacterium]
MEEKVRLSYLFDFYGDLLNSKQNEIFQTFVFQDLSLQEMADELGVSRQAVHEKVRRSIQILENYEKRLRLLEKYRRICDIADTIETELEESPAIAEETCQSVLEKLTEIKEVF